jgi:hypothetical protein
MKVKTYSINGSRVIGEWDVEMFGFPATTGAAAAIAGCRGYTVTYEPFRPPDWTSKITIHKMSRYSECSGTDYCEILRIARSLRHGRSSEGPSGSLSPASRRAISTSSDSMRTKRSRISCISDSSCLPTK